jgi:hypothetical protein
MEQFIAVAGMVIIFIAAGYSMMKADPDDLEF